MIWSDQPIRWVAIITNIYRVTGRGVLACCLLIAGRMRDQTDRSRKVPESEKGVKIIIIDSQNPLTGLEDEIRGIEHYSTDWFIAPSRSGGIGVIKTPMERLQSGMIIMPDMRIK